MYLLWAQRSAAAIQLEGLGSQLAQTYDVDILCGYSLGDVQDGVNRHTFQRICAEHSAGLLPVKTTHRAAVKRHAAASFASRCNSVSETVNSA